MKKSIWKRPGWYFFLVLVVLSIVTLVQAGILGVLPVQYLAIGGVVVALVDALLYLMLVSPRINKVNRVLGFILCVAIIAVFAVGNVYLFRTNTVLDNISHEGQQKNVISVIVMDNSDIQRIEDIQGAIGMAKRIDTEGTQGLLKDLKDKSNLTPQTKEYNSLADLANGLYGSDCDAIILNESYRSMISDEEKYEDFDKETRVIYSYTYYTEIQQTTKNVNVAEDPFTVLVSGIDTYGAIGTTSRSDVNMLVTVNPTTKCIQLVSIPRDYYVQTQCDEGSGCAVGEMDKLTHTGLHGVDTTKRTLENLFGIEINYTLRVNFSSVEEIVDALGGRYLEYPIVLDLEDSMVLNSTTREKRTEIIQEYKKIVERAGYKFALYANKNWLENYIEPEALEGVDIWLARWRSLDQGPGYNGPGNVTMWQYTNSGSVSGISGNVDRNVSYKNYK